MLGPMRERCRAFAQSLRSLGDAAPFLKPVDQRVYTDYATKIAPGVPMDMGHIARRLRDRAQWYATFDDMEADFRLIFANCRAYNERPVEDAGIRGMADRLEARLDAFVADVHSAPEAPGPRSKAAAEAAAAADAGADDAAAPPAPRAARASPEREAAGGGEAWVQCDR